MIYIPWLAADTLTFPPVESALKHPNGLLAAGGDLSSQRLIAAYQQGIFPWYETGQPILWWCPDPRTVLFPAELKISRSLSKTLRQKRFTITFDRVFEQVIRCCAAPRKNAQGTWITEEIIIALCQLHHEGFAHSVEAWQDKQLVGGLYGISIGKIFFGESMFARQTDASKIAFIHLARHLQASHCPMIDCQVANPHLTSLGAREISLTQFRETLQANTLQTTSPLLWPIPQD
jgi:leucyl/phenylalanyl-tRNA--protein transferase